ncbi:MAG: carbohydrate ABC transporter permease [Chloroflexi bacterium]|nr:carbohydrate ABC transporter permease [Chloroflexota bacterium]
MRSIFNRQKRSSLAFNYTVIFIMLVFALGPIIIMLMNSIKSPAELGKNPLGFPQNPQFENYPNAWERGGFAVTVPNTLKLVAGTVIGIMIFGGMAAYSLAKLNLPGANILTLYFLIQSSLPVQLFLVPLFFLWRVLGLVNTHIGLIIIYIATNSAFAIFLLRSYMVQIPSDFEDAARVDGANELQVFRHVIIPLSWPAFLTVGLVVGLNVWNEFLMATVFLTKPELYTVVTSYWKFASRFGRDWGMTNAGAVMMILPIMLLFMMLQRQFIAGLTQGGLKG